MSVWLLFMACVGLGGGPSPYVPLEAPRLLRRISLDLLGGLPSVDELDAVEADPTALDGIVEDYLQDPRLEERLVHIFHESWHTRVDRFNITRHGMGVAREDEISFERSVGEEPLRLMARVVADDLPWSAVVTADWTMANGWLLDKFPLEAEGEPGHGWQPARYTDGRPAVGVLATNGLWWRYPTTQFNLNRGRAAALNRLLLCFDFLSLPVSFVGIAGLEDEAGIEEAIRSEPACQACHAALDPVASILFGFWWVQGLHPDETTRYHPERELMGPEELGVASAWFGEPVSSLAELGPTISRDPRFSRCVVETLGGTLWRRPTGLDDLAELDALHEKFVGAGLRVKALLQAIVATDEYRAGDMESGADPQRLGQARTQRLLDPDQLAGAVEAATGFVWTVGGNNPLDHDDGGYRLMIGGVDGDLLKEAQRDPSVTLALVADVLGQMAGQELAAQLDRAGLDSTAGDLDAVRTEIAAQQWAWLGIRPSPEDLDGLVDLWQAIHTDAGAQVAWAAVVAAQLQSPEFLSR